MQQSQLVPESRVVGHLQKLFKLKASTIEAFFLEMDQLPENHFPFLPSSIVWVNESMPVTAAVANPTPSARLARYMLDFYDVPLLVTDSRLTGAEALYLVQMVPDIDTASDWLRKQSTPSLMINHLKGDVFLAAPLKSFV